MGHEYASNEESIVEIGLRPIDEGERNEKQRRRQHQPCEEAKIGSSLQLALAAGKLGAFETRLRRRLFDPEHCLATA